MPKDREALLSSAVRRSITDLVAADPDRWTASRLAEELDLHVTTVRFHLDQLEQAGVLESGVERRDRPGRPSKVYRRRAEAVPVNTAAYVVLADVLAETLGGDEDARVEAATRAGEAWSRHHLDHVAPEGSQGEVPVRELLDVLARWGYPRETVTVEGDPAGRCQATLTHCPMKAAAVRHPDVVCAIHLGLVRGSLEGLGVQDPAVRVTPMVAPDVCTVEMSGALHAGEQVAEGLDLAHVRRRPEAASADATSADATTSDVTSPDTTEGRSTSDRPSEATS